MNAANRGRPRVPRRKSQRASESHLTSVKQSETSTRVAVGGSARVTGNSRLERVRRPRTTRNSPRKKQTGTQLLGEINTAVTTADGQPPAKFPAFLIVLVLVTLVAFVALGQPLSQWWKQNREYNAISQKLAEAKAENQRLTSELEKWQSDSFIASQARSRLGYIRPGETQYLVVDAPNEAGSKKQTRSETTLPWYLVIMDSVKLAEEIPAPPPEGDGN
ncbi:septum formation initiator family protein [Gleimia sp. 6138-11-ORH1]|uniref:FtsB family cell division protein n=1 Tax=Gleimia sp. 6138-11-ORH1 TaxID=2973937 RepID=UPI00216A218F|nr:septum formation initiator family protein [Gleimia sp. 6138-11-ORH1]MCS4485213.1 septum formation initiator family protein [Gleimia sp. 6138-11-ORH1]